MNHTKKILVVAATALIGSALIGVGSASATALCKTSPSTHICPLGDSYNSGTEISSSLQDEAVFRSGNTVVQQCAGGTYDLTVQPRFGTQSVPANAAMSFAGCNAELPVITGGSAEIRWQEGTHDGTIFHEGPHMKIKFFGVTCPYAVVGQADLIGGASSRVVFDDTVLFKTTGEKFLCPQQLTLDAEYAVESPAPLFVEDEAYL